MDLVKKAGYVPIIITNNDSHQPWISKSNLDDCVILPLTFPLQETPGDVAILRALFEQFKITGILIHHNQWMYDNIPWVKRFFPGTPIVDSLHIVEYKYHGGYPKEAIAHDKWIDLHHVISPQLKYWLVNIHHIDERKIVLAPLTHLSSKTLVERFKEARTQGKLTVAFIGRMDRQKRPEAFILAARRLNKRYPGRFSFIMQGNGKMDSLVTGLIKKSGLSAVMELRDFDEPVSTTYHDSDVLLLSSVDEGITLTTIEAIGSGIPVVSTRVGSQATLIPREGLCRRNTQGFISDVMKTLPRLLSDENRRRLWEKESAQLKKLSRLESADDFFADLLSEWGTK